MVNEAAHDPASLELSPDAMRTMGHAVVERAVAHLAGSLGVPVWNLLHDRPYWLYLQDRMDCPWYASMTLYRQPKPGDWDSVFAQVADDLRQLAAAKKS